MPYASSWLERLRSIKRLRQKIVESNRNDSAMGGGGGMGMGASDHHHHAVHHQQSSGVGGVSPQALARKYQMDDFTTYTQ